MFQKGHKKIGGKVKGTPNKLTATVKESVLSVFQALQDDPDCSLEAFARANLKDFYIIAAKLIPTEIKGDVKENITLTIHRAYRDNPEQTA